MIGLGIMALCGLQFNATTYASNKSKEAILKTILFLGDSISVGAGASNDANRYTTLVAKELSNEKEILKEINVAVSGSTLVNEFGLLPFSSGYPYILKEAIKEKPDIFVIQHGTNDNAAGVSLGQFLWTYRQMIQEIKRDLPQTKIVCMTICPSWSFYAATEIWLNQANVGIQEIAAIENVLLAHTNLKLKNRRGLFPDRIHPNDEGHRIMAESVIDALRDDHTKSKDSFDFVCSYPGQYRICGYVFDVEILPRDISDGWVCFYNVQKDVFKYMSDYNIELTSPFKFYDKDFTAKRLTGEGQQKELKKEWCDSTGMGQISLPKTKSDKIIVKISF